MMRWSLGSRAELAGMVLGLLLVTALVIRAQAMGRSAQGHTLHTTAVASVATTVTVSPQRKVTGTPIPIPGSSAAGVPTSVPTDATVASTRTGAAWITLGAYTVAPGVWTVPLHGAGFSPREPISLRVAGAVETVPAALAADRSGDVDGTAELEVPPDATGTVQLMAVGVRSHLQATATFGVVPLVALLSLSPYAALPGAPVDVFAQGYAPHEPVDLAVGGKLLRMAHADDGGTLRLSQAFTVPYGAMAGPLAVAVTGAWSHHSAWQNLTVEALQPWATASSYAAHPGDHIHFDAHGFALGEQVAVYAGDTLVARSIGSTDGQGNISGLGPVTVPSGDPQVAFTLMGKRSGARLTVTIAVLQ